MLTHIDSSINADRTKVESFLDIVEQKLDYQPKTADELREAWNHFDDIEVKMNEFRSHYNSLKDKIYLIKNLGRIQPKSEEVLDRWENLENRIKNFQSELRDKQENMKSEIIEKAKNFSSDISKFENKWSEIKLGENEKLSRKVGSEYITVLTHIHEEWKVIKSQIERILRDLTHFNISADTVDEAHVDEINNDIIKEVQNWKTFDQFEKTMKDIEAKKHIGNGKNIFDFQDILVEWNGIVKNKKNQIEIFISKLVEEYQIIWPGLKLIIGESFEREHWNSLMHILGLKGITSDNLLFGHLIADPSGFLKKINEIKELAARAQGEVTIREAIQELENW